MKHVIVGFGVCVGLMAGAQVPPPAFVTQEDAFEETCDGVFWHVQGIAISDDAVYCGLLKNIVKFDLATGKCLKGVSAPHHTGDVCWHNGRLTRRCWRTSRRRGRTRPTDAASFRCTTRTST